MLLPPNGPVMTAFLLGFRLYFCLRAIPQQETGMTDSEMRAAVQAVPVGTMVTHRPPVRSVRAALPHTAPIGCCDGK
ncbi:hypothetical protein CN141_32915, partial [Sinorhizobium meliloti]